MFSSHLCFLPYPHLGERSLELSTARIFSDVYGNLTPCGSTLWVRVKRHAIHHGCIVYAQKIRGRLLQEFIASWKIGRELLLIAEGILYVTNLYHNILLRMVTYLALCDRIVVATGPLPAMGRGTKDTTGRQCHLSPAPAYAFGPALVLNMGT